MTEYRYIDETSWTPFPIAGLSNPQKDFYVRHTITVSGQDYSRTKFVQVKRNQFTLELGIIDNVNETSFELSISGDTGTATYILKINDVVTTYSGSRTDVNIGDKIEVEANVTPSCGIFEGALKKSYVFEGTAPDCSGLDLDFVIEGGAYKAIRVGEPCCVETIDLLFYKYTENGEWIQLEEDETVYSDEIWFRRFVVYEGNVCDNFSKIIKAK